MGAEVNMIPKMPAKVKRCISHHPACACREWKYEQMEMALKAIHIWAWTWAENENEIDKKEIVANLKSIADTAYKAVHCLDKARNKDDR